MLLLMLGCMIALGVVIVVLLIGLWIDVIRLPKLIPKLYQVTPASTESREERYKRRLREEYEKRGIPWEEDNDDDQEAR